MSLCGTAVIMTPPFTIPMCTWFCLIRTVPVMNGGLVVGVDFVLRFPIVDAYADDGLFALYWQAVFGTTYQVKRSPDPLAWTNAPSGTNANQQSHLVSPVQGIIRYEDPEPLGSNNYYRIEIIP